MIDNSIESTNSQSNPIGEYRQPTAEEIAREEEWYREKRLHDQASEITDAWLEGWFKGFLGIRLKQLLDIREDARRRGVEFPHEKNETIELLETLLNRLDESFVSFDEIVEKLSEKFPGAEELYEDASERAEAYYESYLLREAKNEE